MSGLYRFLLYRNNNFRSAAVRASHSLLREPGQAGRTAKQGIIPMLPYLILYQFNVKLHISRSPSHPPDSQGTSIGILSPPY